MGFFKNLRKKAICETFLSVYCHETAINPELSELEVIRLCVRQVFVELVDTEASKFERLVSQSVEGIMSGLPKTGDFKKEAVVLLWRSWTFRQGLKSKNPDYLVKNFLYGGDDIHAAYENALDKYTKKSPAILSGKG